MDEACGGPDVIYCQQRARLSFLCKYFWPLAIWVFGLVSLSIAYLPQDLKETSRLKSGFIHATRGGWEQLPLLKDQLLESQEKLVQAYKDLLAATEEK